MLMICYCNIVESRVGYFIGHHYAGAFAYADDIVLIAPSPSAMRTMLSICNKFTVSSEVCFNTLKSKCIIIRPKNERYCTLYHYRNVHMTSFQINDKGKEFVDRYKHTINATLDDNDDS